MAQSYRQCPSCGSKIPLGVSFCGFCGEKISPIEQPSSDPSFDTQAPTQIDQSFDTQVPTQLDPAVLPESSIPAAAVIQESPELVNITSSWKSPFWITLAFGILILPAAWFAELFLGFWGLLAINLGSGVLYAAVLRHRCNLDTRQRFAGTILASAAVWTLLFLLLGG